MVLLLIVILFCHITSGCYLIILDVNTENVIFLGFKEILLFIKNATIILTTIMQDTIWSSIDHGD